MRWVLWLKTAYVLSSASLIVVNKVCVRALSHAPLILLTQLISTTAAFSALVMLRKGAPAFSSVGAVGKAYMGVAAAFLATIFSNIKFLESSSVNAFIVLRSCTPLVVLVVDCCTRDRGAFTCKNTVCLAGVAACSCAYALASAARGAPPAAETGASAPAFWGVVWTVAFVVDTVYIKHVVHAHPCSSFERTVYQNGFASVILCAAWVAATHEPLREAAGVLDRLDADSGTAVCLSCAIGAVLSFSAMALRSELAPTEFALLGVICKMGSVFLNEFVDPERSYVRLCATIGAVVCASRYAPPALKCDAGAATGEPREIQGGCDSV